MLVDGNFKSGDFTYFKKLDEDGDLIKYVYKYLTKSEKIENKIFKILKIKKQIYSQNFFNGVSKNDLMNLNYYFYKILKDIQKLKAKIEFAEDQLREELEFKINLVDEEEENISMNIINAVHDEKIFIIKNEKIRNKRYERNIKLDENIFRIPVFDLLTKKAYIKNYIKYKYDVNREKYIANKNYYDFKNIFSLTYKQEFLRDYCQENFKNNYALDKENLKKYYMMNAEIQKRKIEEFAIRRLEELKNMDDKYLTEAEKNIKKYGDENAVIFHYKDDIQYLKSQFNEKFKNLFLYTFEEIKEMFDHNGVLKINYNDTEHLTNNFKYDF